MRQSCGTRRPAPPAWRDATSAADLRGVACLRRRACDAWQPSSLARRFVLGHDRPPSRAALCIPLHATLELPGEECAAAASVSSFAAVKRAPSHGQSSAPPSPWRPVQLQGNLLFDLFDLIV